MTQDDVIRLATQARLPHDYETEKPVWLDKLEMFAKLVAEHEREKCAEYAPLSRQMFNILNKLRQKNNPIGS